MNFSQVKGLSIPQGSVKQLAQGQTVLWKKGQALPYDAEVAYLIGDGTQYINTGVECTGDLTIEGRAYWPTNDNLAIAGGIKQVSGSTYFRHHFSPVYNTPGNLYWYQQNNSGSASMRGNVKAGAFYTISVNGSTGAWSLGGASGTVTTVSGISTTGKGYGLFARISDAGAIQAKASSWAWCKLSRGGVLLGDFVAVRKNGVGYLYDKVSAQLFANAGTGSFTLGPDKSVVDSYLGTAVLTALPSITVLGTKQGACTDGTYIYQFDSAAYVGIKYKISDGTYTTVSLSPQALYNHGNDLTFNPLTGHIYLAPQTSDGALIEMDTDWNYVATHTLLRPDSTPATVWGIAYDRLTGHYLSAWGQDKMLVYDSGFNCIGTIDMMRFLGLSDYAQGIETDGTYIYRSWGRGDYVDVATMDGRYVTHISVPGLHELESIMYDWNGHWYMSDNYNTGFLYEAQIKV